jgi:hypothetical protein
MPGEMPAVNDQVIVARVTECNGPMDTAKAANDYMQIGFANVYAACEAFFVNATRFQQNALATTNSLDASLVGATSIINATNSTAAALKAVTIATAGVTLGKTVVNDFVTVYTFGTHLYKVRQLVHSDMDNFVATVKPPADTCLAYAYVQGLATKCTLANMQALLDAQVAIPSTAQANAPVAPATTTPAAGGGVALRTGFRLAPTQRSGTLPPIGSSVVPLQTPPQTR